MHFSLFLKWISASACLTLLAYILIPPGKPSRRYPDFDHRYAATYLHPHLIDINDWADPSLGTSSIAQIQTVQKPDDYLPYFALIRSLPDLVAQEAIGTCDFTAEELHSFQYDSDAWWRIEPRPESEIAELRTQWKKFLKQGLIPWSQVSHQFDGAGIVVVAGQDYSLKRLAVMLRVLRQQYDSILPVEVNFHSDDISETQKTELMAIYGSENMSFNDLSLPTQIWQTSGVNKVRALNYQLKTAALLNSRFEEILMLDSDNIPVIDPANLFLSKTYQRYGSVFWPDITRTRPEHPAWRITNTACRRDEYEFETGQLMVKKSRYWYHLQLAAWLHTQPYWQKVILGDKDLFRFAWHILKTDFGRPVRWLTSIGVMAEHPARHKDGVDETRMAMGFCGHTYAQHHPDHSIKAGDTGSGIVFLHGGNLKTFDAPLLATLKGTRGGLFMYYKSLDVEKAEDWSQIEYRAFQRMWNVGWFLNHTSERGINSVVSINDEGPVDDTVLQRLELNDLDRHAFSWCTDFAHVKPRPLSDFGWEELGFEILFTRAGGYWMIEEGYRNGRFSGTLIDTQKAS